MTELTRALIHLLGDTVPEPNTGCLLWTASCNTSGYGICSRDLPGKRLAHRAAWILAKGAVPDGMFVLHRCDTRSCVNVDHLFLGSIADNNADRDRKGRQVAPRFHGETNGAAKLSDVDVLSIVRLRASGWTQREIAERHGVSQSQVSFILLGKRRAQPSRVVLGQGAV